VTSFDVYTGRHYGLEIFGTEGTLVLPDPNTFGGPVTIYRPAERAYVEQPLSFGHAENSRGVGIADMAQALREGRPHRASGEMAYHVLDIMHAIHDSSREGRHIELASTMERPAPLPAGWTAFPLADSR
jgi:predicted dehydrogenase